MAEHENTPEVPREQPAAPADATPPVQSSPPPPPEATSSSPAATGDAPHGAARQDVPADTQPVIDNRQSARPDAGHAPHKKRMSVGAFLKTAFVRVYTLALAGSIAFVCFWAIIYLFKYVFLPAKLPPSMTHWQGELDPRALRLPNVPGTTGESGRAPTGHYHKVGRWFQTDPLNGCTTSGCHSPLPHEQKSKIAAFANLHVTFMDCMVCHDPSAKNPGRISAHWIRTANYQRQEVPAVLRLMTTLDGLKPDLSNGAELHAGIVSLLQQVIETVGREAPLPDLLAQIDSTQPNSPLWKKSVQALIRELPRHARGEYSAKITRDGAVKDVKSLADATKAYLAAPAGSPQREAMKKSLHQGVLEQPSACATCHSKESTAMLDFEAMGYPAARAKSLRDLPLARMAEDIRKGGTFQLPKLMEGGDGR